MLTAEGEKYGCDVCLSARGSLTTVAASSNEQLSLLSGDPSKNIVFFIADFETCPTLFKNLKVNTVPRTFILPIVRENDPKYKISDYAINDNEVMSPKLLISSIEKIAQIKITASYNPIPIITALIIFAILLAYVVSVASQNLEAALLWYRSPYIWCFISFVCFSVGVSGSISCIIRSAPLYVSGSSTLFASRGREQYLLEGIIVALWTLGCGLSLVLSFLSTKIPIPPVRHVLVILGFAMFVVFSLQIWNAYVDKTPWYSIKDTVPEEVWRWLSSSVKKSSGVLKRLLRVSEIYLWEFKDLQSLQKRAKPILFDYLKKYLSSLRSGGKSN